MDKNRVKGEMKDLKGRVKRQVGEWTGDSKLQSEGAVDQVEGKVQNLYGQAKDKVQEITHGVADGAKDETPECRTHDSRSTDRPKRTA